MRSSEWRRITAARRRLRPGDRWELGCDSALPPSAASRRVQAEAYGARCGDGAPSELLMLARSPALRVNDTVSRPSLASDGQSDQQSWTSERMQEQPEKEELKVSLAQLNLRFHNSKPRNGLVPFSEAFRFGGGAKRWVLAKKIMSNMWKTCSTVSETSRQEGLDYMWELRSRYHRSIVNDVTVEIEGKRNSSTQASFSRQTFSHLWSLMLAGGLNKAN